MKAGMLDPEFLIGASLADDRFKIVARVGAGSMAIVYRAFDHRLETEVVVKVPKKHKLMDDGLRERFRRESRLLVQLQHPHIVSILDVGLHGNIPFVVMQYLSGGCLSDKMQARNGQPTALPVDSLRKWLLQIAKALDFAHQRKVIHRDVKPANILFDESGNAFLSDFGLTKIMYGEPDENAADETAAGYVIGTPNFVAPEIVLGADYDGRADQYSLAISVYNTLVGTPPMLGKTPSATMVNQTRRVLPLISEVRKAVPVATAQALAKALNKKPDHRFETCEEFAEAAIAGLTTAGLTVTTPELSPAPLPVSPPRKSVPADSSVKSKSDATSATSPKRKRPPRTDRMESIPGSSGVAINTGRVSRSKTPGVINCPQCRKEFRLRQEHAGRNGRCAQCATRLRIGADLMTLTILPERSSDATGSSGSSGTGSAEDLIIGEKVFGLKLSRNAMLGLGGVLLIIVIAALVIFFLQLSKPDLEKQERQMQQRFQNRETI
jgi:serine/threonine-protein kinase